MGQHAQRGSMPSVSGCSLALFLSSQLLCCMCVPPSPILSAAGDVGLMADLLKDLEDPETLKEVEKLMKVIRTS